MPARHRPPGPRRCSRLQGVAIENVCAHSGLRICVDASRCKGAHLCQTRLGDSKPLHSADACVKTYRRRKKGECEGEVERSPSSTHTRSHTAHRRVRERGGWLVCH